jgi:hypothetical protein
MKTIGLDEVKTSLKPPERIAALQAERDQVKRSFKEYKKEHGQLGQLMAEVLAAVPILRVSPPTFKPSRKDALGSDLAACLHISDGHHGAVQEVDEVEGFGMFSPDISRARQIGVARDFLEWVELHRRGYSIPEARVICTGDMVSGDIHDELRVTNAFPAPVQSVEAAQILADQVALLSPRFSRVIVDVITLDNHGRMTRKPQCKEGGLNNWMYVVSRLAEVLLRGHKNVQVNTWAMPQKVISVCGRRYLLCHGHEVSGWMGFPYYGIERKASREAMKRMNGPDVTKFDKIIMGHWHAPMEHPVFWIGGSVSGTDAYDHQAGRSAKPQQVSWLVHPTWGEFDRTCWQLDRYDPKD